jgi:hypothetical protein
MVANAPDRNPSFHSGLNWGSSAEWPRPAAAVTVSQVDSSGGTDLGSEPRSEPLEAAPTIAVGMWPGAWFVDLPV